MNRCGKRLMVFWMMIIAMSGAKNGDFSANQDVSSQQMPLDARLMYLFARDHPTLFEIEREIGLHTPVTLKLPTISDPVWWFVYEYQGLVLELGANGGEFDLTIDTADRAIIPYAGYFKIRSPEEAAADDGYSTYCIPTAGESSRNQYADFLIAYNMRQPISIKGLEMALALSDPIDVESPFYGTDPMWKFFYRISNCTIRLYGRDLSYQNEERTESSAKERRGEFLFTGYWVVGCSKSE